MKRIVSAAILMIALMTGLAMPANAETPPNNISTNVVDKSESLDSPRVTELVAQVQRETGYQLYVYFTNDFSGTSGAQWAYQAATNSHLDSSKTVLFAVAVKDRLYGSAFPSNSDVSAKGSTMEQAAIPYMKSGKWTEAVEAYANQLIAIVHKKDAESAQNSGQADAAGGAFLTVMTWIISILVGLGLIIVGAIFGRRGVSAFLDYVHAQKVTRQEIRELLLSVPARISALDDSIVKSTEKLAYAVSMYGELPLFSAKLHSAQINLQNAIKKLSKVSKSSFGLRNMNYRLRELSNVIVPISRGEDNVSEVEKSLKDLENRAGSIKRSISQGIETTDDLQKKIHGYEETLVRVQSKFDADYLSGLVAAVSNAKKNVVASQQSLAEASAAFENNNFDRADELVKNADEKTNIAKRNLDAFNETAQKMSHFSTNRDKLIYKLEDEISADTPENAHPSVKPLITAAQAALNEAIAMEFISGNPDRDLAKVLEPVNEYRNAVDTLVKLKVSVKEAKVRANTSIKAMKNWQKTALVTNIKEYGITVTPLEKVAISEVAKIMDVDVAQVASELNAVSPFDLSATVTLSKKLNYLNSNIQSLVASLTAKTETAIAAEKRHQAELRAEEERKQEEQARKRKREQEEQARKRKREQEEEDARRRSSSSSYSSSSFGSYGGGYSSGSDFSSSGGSFGGGFDSSGGGF
jgi:uncharacterized membrane protein YgcG